jgi:hypothetical protein
MDRPAFHRQRGLDLPNQLHHVVMRSHSAGTFIQFLTDVVGMDIQAQFHVPGEVLEATLSWPPSEGADVTMLGSGDSGLVEVLDVPENLREFAPEGLAAMSFLTDDYHNVQDKARTMAPDVTVLFGDVPGVNLFFCTMGGVPIEFMGSYDADSVSATVATGDSQ